MTDHRKIYVTMDMCEVGLNDIIREKRFFTEEEAKVIMRQLLKALNHCHEMGVVHRDIKAQNIMIVTFDSNEQHSGRPSVYPHSSVQGQEDWHIKLIDWGIACKIKEGEKLTLPTGSPLYMAPEVIQGLYDNKCDVWSCGILMYYMLTGNYPFKGASLKGCLAYL